jgi:hypothetical protein
VENGTEHTEGDAMTDHANVFEAISAVAHSLSETGIGKGGYNEFDKYHFRGIDQVYDTLGPVLSANKLLILPTVEERHQDIYESTKGTKMVHVILKIRYDFIYGPKPDLKYSIVVYGEAMDRGDKATNKAMSAGYKYAVIQAFAIPVVGEPDPDNETPDIKGTSVVKASLAGIKIDQVTRDDYVTSIRMCLSMDDDPGLFEMLDELTDQDLKIAVWGELSSKERSTIKKLQAERRETA